jgi:hypothetical protein
MNTGTRNWSAIKHTYLLAVSQVFLMVIHVEQAFKNPKRFSCYLAINDATCQASKKNHFKVFNGRTIGKSCGVIFREICHLIVSHNCVYRAVAR